MIRTVLSEIRHQWENMFPLDFQEYLETLLLKELFKDYLNGFRSLKDKLEDAWTVEKNGDGRWVAYYISPSDDGENEYIQVGTFNGGYDDYYTWFGWGTQSFFQITNEYFKE